MIVAQLRISEMKMTSSCLIIFLTTGLAYGGAETQLVRLATRLKARGWEVKVVSMLPPQAYVEELEGARIPVETLGMRRGVPDPRALLRLVRILRREQPQVLTSFMYHANVLGRLAGRLAEVPVVVSSIRNENFGGPWRDKVMRLTDSMADVTTINSCLAAEAVVRRGVVPPGRLRVIPNGLEVERYRKNSEARRQARQQLGLEDSDFLWLAVGRLEIQKDYPTLLRAFVRVSSVSPLAQLRIAGQGPLREDLQVLVSNLGIAERVRFLGVRADIPDLLSAADAFVLSSAWEGLPNVVMEALAAGKPVVATRVGGVPELVEEGKSGFLVPPKDPEALARAMLRLMDLSLEERLRMGERGRRHIEENYSLERVVDQWEALYKELLELKRRGL